MVADMISATHHDPLRASAYSCPVAITVASSLSVVDVRERPEFAPIVADRLWSAWWKPKRRALAFIEDLVHHNLDAEPIPVAVVAGWEGMFLDCRGDHVGSRCPAAVRAVGCSRPGRSDAPLEGSWRCPCSSGSRSGPCPRVRSRSPLDRSCRCRGDRYRPALGSAHLAGTPPAAPPGGHRRALCRPGLCREGGRRGARQRSRPTPTRRCGLGCRAIRSACSTAASPNTARSPDPSPGPNRQPQSSIARLRHPAEAMHQEFVRG